MKILLIAGLILLMYKVFTICEDVKKSRMTGVQSQICDEPGCSDAVVWGFQTPQGYRQTCHKHWYKAQQKEIRR